MNTTELIKEKLSIDEVIRGYIPIELHGGNYKARCPFHDEKTASFNITPSKQMFYCFGCHVGGDIFDFVQKIENISFREALEKLAYTAGVPLEHTHNKQGGLRRIYEIMDIATRYYHAWFRKNTVAVEYLLQRGMTKETMIRFRLGYSPGYDQIIQVLKNKKYTQDEIVASGIAIAGTRGLFDRFSHRIMFPTADGQDRYVAFSGRILPGDARMDKVGKYINSPETEIYHKSKILFAYGLAKKSIIEKKYVILVEGHMDVIMLHQAGYTNTVGISGTACTSEHIELVSRLTDTVVIVFDQDRAGIAATDKLAPLCIAKSLTVYIIQYTEKDPAEIIENNPEKFTQYIEQKQEYFEYLLERIKKTETVNNYANAVKKIVFPVIASIPLLTIRRLKVEYFARGFSWSVDDLMSDFLEYYKVHHTVKIENPYSSYVQKTLPDTVSISDNTEKINNTFIKDIVCFSVIYQDQYPEIIALMHVYIPQEIINQYISEITEYDKNIYIQKNELFPMEQQIKKWEQSVYDYAKKIIKQELDKNTQQLRMYESGQIKDIDYDQLLSHGILLSTRMTEIQKLMQ